MSLLKLRLTAAIFFQENLHGFWAGQGTGTAALESKLLQQLTSMREAVIFKVFLDIWKAYNTLDRERALDLLILYGVGLRTVQLLRTYWDQLTMVAKAGGYFVHPFKRYRGVTQVNPLYPTIFNLVVDAVICH